MTRCGYVYRPDLRHAGVSCGVDEDFGGATAEDFDWHRLDVYLCAMDEAGRGDGWPVPATREGGEVPMMRQHKTRSSNKTDGLLPLSVFRER